MKDNKVIALIFAVCILGGSVGAFVQYTFDSITVSSLEKQLALYETYKDSDSDGFSDWHEIYVSFTNPFNVSDKPEINYWKTISINECVNLKAGKEYFVNFDTNNVIIIELGKILYDSSK